MKRIVKLLLLLLVGESIFAQNVTLVKEFSFGKPFKFATRWDENEGPIPGPGKLYFLNDDTVLTTDGMTGTYVFFDKSWNVIASYTRGWGSQHISIGYKNVLIGTFSNVEIPDPIWLFSRTGPFNNPVKLTAPKREGSSDLLVTGDWVFSVNATDKLVSWELRGGKPIYRNQEATEKLLTKEGLGVELGYKKKAPPFDFYQFGSRFVTFMNVSEPVVPNQFNGYSYNAQQAKNYELNTSPFSLVFADVDSKGLYYFWAITPTLISTEDEPYKTETNQKKQLVFGIADPWTKRLIFRALSPGAWTPPISKKRGLLGTYPVSVDRKGQIYFFDADEDRRVYELKRLLNDWWKELNVDTRIVGIVNDNRVRIRDAPDISSKVTSYVYEDEYVWVREQGMTKETVDGKTAPWYLIEMPDGRKGWVFGAFVDIHN